MTTQTRNEAAERLRDTIGANSFAAEALDEALAAERRATVERIRTAYLGANVDDGPEMFNRGIDAASAALFAILDEEASGTTDVKAQP